MHETFSSSISCLSAGVRLGGACKPVGGKISDYEHCRFPIIFTNYNGKEVLCVFFFSGLLRIVLSYAYVVTYMKQSRCLSHANSSVSASYLQKKIHLLMMDDKFREYNLLCVFRSIWKFINFFIKHESFGVLKFLKPYS